MDSYALAQELARHQMRWAFGIPGGGPSLQLVDELIRLGTNFITTGHETTAALMAGAVSKFSKTPSAAISIKGPGLMNLAPGLLSNAYEGYPMLSIAEAYPPGNAGTRRHKWLAHERILTTFAKDYSYWGTDSDVVEHCWARATEEFPGPVHLELAEGPGFKLENRIEITDDPSEAMALVRSAERPVVILGSMALRAPWREHLQRLQLPIFTTVAAKGVISELSPFAAGIYTGDGKTLSPENVMLTEADLLVTIGVRSGEVLSPVFPNTACIQLDTPAVRSRGVFPPNGVESVSYFSDLHVTELLHALEQKSWGEDEILGAFSTMEKELRPWEWSPARIYQMVTEALPDAVHVLDTGNFTVVGEHLLRVKTERDILGTPNGRYMGFGIGYALGTAIATDNRPVVLWIGDGGIRAFFSELSLAVEHKLKILVMVMCDGFFGSVRGRAKAKGWSTEPLRMQGRDLRCIAEGMGIDTLVIDDDEFLADGLQAWRTSGQPMLIRCDFDADEYARVAELLR
jgi:acetolactate synthase-1/2/3 large subunit